MLPLIFEVVQPRSIVDVGCGLGQWLRAFRERGVEDLLGIDGPHVPLERLEISEEEFLSFDLSQAKEFHLSRKFDLAISLEVAEHLKEEVAEPYVDMLTSLSDKIVFSAAIPHQTGENHFNEQPPNYWALKFQARGYVMLDAFRGRIWNEDSLSWWYRQNTFLVVKKELLDQFPFPESALHLVHPELLALHVRSYSMLQDHLNQLEDGQHGFRKAFQILFNTVKGRLKVLGFVS